MAGTAGNVKKPLAVAQLEISSENVSSCCTHRQEAVRVFTIPTQQHSLAPDEATLHQMLVALLTTGVAK